MAATKAPSISKSVVSSKCASEAGRRGIGPIPVPFVPSRHLGADIVELEIWVVLPEFRQSAGGADLQIGVDEQLYVGIGAHHGADIPAFHHRALRILGWALGELALEIEQCGADRGMGRNDRGGFAGLFLAQRWVRETCWVERLGGGQGGIGVRGIVSRTSHGQTDRTIERASIKVRIAKRIGYPSGQGAFAGGRRAVDRDDHRFSGTTLAPSPAMSAAKPGKLVPIMLSSSMVTAFFAARPRIVNAMAIR